MTISRVCIAALLSVSILSLASAQQSTSAASKHEPALDVTSMDRTVDPCADFFKYSCGGWIKNNPIPPDQSSWSTYSKMQDENRARLRGILETAAVPDARRDAAAQKIGDYYASCMDENAINAKGVEPLKPELERIAGITSKADLAAVVANMSRDNVLIAFSSMQEA